MLRLGGGHSLGLLPCPIRDATVQLGVFLAMLLSNRTTIVESFCRRGGRHGRHDVAAASPAGVTPLLAAP